MSDLRTTRFRIEGRVQGVGFRRFAQHRATEVGVRGWVRNVDDAVECEVVGSPEQIDAMRSALARGPAGAHVISIRVVPSDDREAAASTFEVRG